MEVAERLDELRLSFPECRTLAFADLSTGMILSASSEEKVRQEQLDCLCDTAVEMLCGDTAKRIGQVLCDRAGTGVFQAVIVDSDEVGIFIRSTVNPVDAFCCVCTSAIKLDAFMKDARKNLAVIGQNA